MKDISCFGEPKINYPCMWEYKAFVSVDCDEKDFFNELLSPHQYKLKLSKQNAKYKCFNIILLVNNQAHRLEIFEILKSKCAFVL